MRKKFSFNHLSDTEFEEYCFELIKELGFKNVDWRKGTGKSTSPSDMGRDIEAEKIIEDVDGETSLEKYFFECKHHMEGVSPSKIQSALSWAMAENPVKLVFICSNFLTNPCKEYLKKYVQENKPRFKIKIWELKELEELSIGKVRLLNKYKLSDGLDFLDIMHPVHIKYVSRPHANSLNYFFSLLDKFDSKKREELLQFAYAFFIVPHFRDPITGKETLRELQINETTYDSLKQKCYKLSEVIPHSFIVKSLVNLLLEWAFHMGDKTNLDSVLKRNQSMLVFMTEQLEKKNQEDSIKKIDKDTLDELIKMIRKRIEELPKSTEDFYSLYNDFCESILSKLMEEDVMKNAENNLKGDLHIT
ncbi:MAG: restriction endonuclease [Candidatus Omnitrophota bacterium]|nr:restriction endonuclease [Candidatus Omnitrophota bacterium]